MERKECPCNGCKERWVSKTDRCHNHCTKGYNEYVEYIHTVTEMRRKDRAQNKALNDIIFASKKSLS